MRIEIGGTIARLRRERGVTQEQLAAAIGVSAPAVSKWETGQSYPDITLLSPLARFFDTSIDALLVFRPELTEEERERLCEAARGTFETEGWQAGLQRCEALAREYPGDGLLRIFLASVVTESLVFAGDAAQREEGRARQVDWLHEAMSSTEGKTQLLAENLLGVFYTHMGRYDEAEAIFKEMLDMPDSAHALLATIKMLRGEYEEAMRGAQRELMRGMASMLSTLGTMASLAMKQDDLPRARAYTDAAETVLDAAGARQSHLAHSVAQTRMSLASAAGDGDALLAATQWYVDILLTMRWPEGIFFDSMEQGALEGRAARDQALYALMADDMEANEVYAPIRERPAFRALIERLRGA